MSAGSTSVHLPALSPAEFDVLGEHVFCDDEIGLDWKNVEAMAEDPELSRRNENNERALRAMALAEEHDQTQSDDAERAEVQRLEGKVDLVLALVTALVREQQDRSIICNARFNARGLCWDSRTRVEPDSLLDIECYLLAQWPLPLKLYARVVDCVALGDEFRICTRIEGLSGSSRDWFGKMVFRRHRRMVAQRRRS